MIILIVDDAATNITIYESVLRQIQDVEFVHFTDSAAALEWAQEHRADLALIDYNMPSPNGLEFIERYRAIPSNGEASVIMVTGETERSILHSALEVGANDFLVKPIDPVELVARAKNMLALADVRRKLADHAVWLAAEVRRATTNLRERERETINRLTVVAEFRDNETGMHIVRMGQFCAMIGRCAGLPDDDVEMLLLAAPMHDVGKIAIPDSILLKAGKLDDAEWEVMKQHTVAGFEILKGSSSPLLQNAADIAIGHHEKFDGTGYPYQHAGEDIPIFARICAVSDVFDALTSVRPYKAAWPTEKAVRYIVDRAGAHFDPILVDAFKVALPEILEAKRLYSDPQEMAAVSQREGKAKGYQTASAH